MPAIATDRTQVLLNLHDEQEPVELQDFLKQNDDLCEADIQALQSLKIGQTISLQSTFMGANQVTRVPTPDQVKYLKELQASVNAFREASILMLDVFNKDSECDINADDFINEDMFFDKSYDEYNAEILTWAGTVNEKINKCI